MFAGSSTILTLHQPRRAFGLPNPSAFCVKLETYLRMADIPYEIAPGDPRDAPKGKVPWIVDDGEPLGDSALIIEYLKAGMVIHSMADSRRTSGRSVTRPGNWSRKACISCRRGRSGPKTTASKFNAAELFDGMPEEQLQYIPDMVRKRAIGKLEAQGIGRHDRDEVYAIGVQDVIAFGDLLGDNAWLFGAAPTSYDASAFGVIGNLKDGPFPSPGAGLHSGDTEHRRLHRQNPAALFR